MQNIPSELIITVKNYINITSFKMKGSPDLGQADMDLAWHHREHLLSKYVISIFLPSRIAEGEPLLDNMRKKLPKILTFHIKK